MTNLTHAQTTKLPPEITNLLVKHNIPLSALSLEVTNLTFGQPILSVNSTSVRTPASVIKLVTSLAALELLGPSYLWQTKYYYTGDLKNDTLNGNLIMQGGGDPFLSLERFWQHLQSLKQSGLKHINGHLILDNSRFDLPTHDPKAFDGKKLRIYNVGPDANLVNFSATRFVIQPIDGQIRVFAEPSVFGLKINNQLKAASGKCTSRKQGWHLKLHRENKNRIARFTGSYKTQCGQHSITQAIFNNHEYVFRLFKQLWLDNGGSISGGYKLAKTPKQAKKLGSHSSDTLADIITSINKFSNNVMARQLLINLGVSKEYPLKPATLAKARQTIKLWLDKQGVSLPSLYIDNGSGLSRKSKLSAADLNKILQLGWKSNFSPEFVSSLSLVGLDGTMRKRLDNGALTGRGRIKTGLLDGIRSMAGYVNTKNNQTIAVSMLLQSQAVNYSNGNIIQDAVLQWLYEF